MLKPRYLFVVFLVSIFSLSVGVAGAQQRFPGTVPQPAGVGQKGDGVGIIVVDGAIGQPQPRQPGTRIEPGDHFQPRQPGTRIEPGDHFRPGGADTLQRKDVPRGQRGIGGVIPPDFDDDATSR